MKNTITFFAAFSTLLFSGCSVFKPYTPPIQQGKIISQDIMQQIKPEMTKQQIKYILGSPDVVDPFAQDQWNYIYSYQNSFGSLRTEKRLTLIFKDNKLSKVSGHYSPPEIIYLNK